MTRVKISDFDPKVSTRRRISVNEIFRCRGGCDLAVGCARHIDKLHLRRLARSQHLGQRDLVPVGVERGGFARPFRRAGGIGDGKLQCPSSAKSDSAYIPAEGSRRHPG